MANNSSFRQDEDYDPEPVYLDDRPEPETPARPVLDDEYSAPKASNEKLWYVIHCYSGYENKVRHAIEQGLKPVTAIQMATLNTAQHFRLERFDRVKERLGLLILNVDENQRFFGDQLGIIGHRCHFFADKANFAVG